MIVSGVPTWTTLPSNEEEATPSSSSSRPIVVQEPQEPEETIPEETQPDEQPLEIEP